MDPLQDQDPRKLGGFTLTGRLHRSLNGQMYLGQGPGGHVAAVKVVDGPAADDPSFRERFRRDVAAAAGLRGTHVAELIAADPDARQPWVATRHVDAPTLLDVVRKSGPLSTQRVLELAAGVAAALDGIHAAGLVHGDLQPANVVLAPEGPRVLDLGLGRPALAADPEPISSFTAGTGGFPPERGQGRPAGPASDVFALGGLIYFAATGLRVFGTGTSSVVMFRVLHAEPDLLPLRDWTVHALVMACLAKDPADRPEPAEIVAAALGRRDEQVQAPTRADLRRAAAEAARRRSGRLGMLAAGVAGALAVAGALVMLSTRGDHGPLAVRTVSANELPPAGATAAAATLDTSGPLQATVYFGQLGSVLPQLEGRVPVQVPAGYRTEHAHQCVLTVVVTGVRGGRASVSSSGLGPAWAPAETIPTGSVTDGLVHQQLAVPPAGTQAGEAVEGSAVLRVDGRDVGSGDYALSVVSRRGAVVTWRLGGTAVGCSLV